jgi:gliding motility-associated lipoprotein GldB
MYKKYMNFREELIIVVSLFFTISCTDTTETTHIISKEIIQIKEVEDNATKARIVRLDQVLSKLTSPEDLKKVHAQYPAFFAQYLAAGKRTPTAEDYNRLYQLFTNPELLQFYSEIDRYYKNFEEEQKQLSDILKYTKYYFPSFQQPTIYTLYAGLMEPDISVSDTAIFVCIDWFMGSKATFRPNIYEYMLRRYDKPYLPPMIATALSLSFIQQDKKDETLIADMIFYGKAHYFTERVCPQVADTLNIGYSQSDIKGIDENMAIIWGHFIDHKLFYETSHRIKEQYIGESPFVNEISNKCPGRIGRWLGWQIVRKYMQTHPEVTLEQLMKDTDASKIFKLSGYKPVLPAKK